MGRPETRKATLADHEDVIRILTKAFDDDPVCNWLLRQDHKRKNAFEEFFDVCFSKLAYPHGEVVVTADLHAVAQWVPPGKWKVGLFDQLVMLPRYLRCARGRIARSFKALNNLMKVHPHEPHYYLLQIATEPEHQGKGLARSLMEPVLRRCDQERVGAYLEATREANVAWYQGYGFEVTGVIDMGKGGPPNWAMWRNPGGAI